MSPFLSSSDVTATMAIRAVVVAIVGVPAAVGAALAGAAGWWLRRGSYRRPDDEARLPVSRVWWAVPALAVTYAVLTERSTVPQLLPAVLVFALAGVCVVWIDLDVHRIPTPLVAAAGLAVAASGWAGARLLGDSSRIWVSLAAAAGLAGFYYLMAWFGNLGLGDVRFGAVAGLLLGLHGWTAVWRGTLVTVVIGGLTGIVLLAAGRSRNADIGVRAGHRPRDPAGHRVDHLVNPDTPDNRAPASLRARQAPRGCRLRHTVGS